MLFLLLAALSVLLAVVLIRSPRSRDPGVVRSALVRGGTAYLAGWLLCAATFRFVHSQAGQHASLPVILGIQGVLLVVLAGVLWTALAQLDFHRFERRDLLVVIPFGALSVLAAGVSGWMPMTAALLASPAILRVRWRREVGSGTLALTGLFGVLFVLLSFVGWRVRLTPETATSTLQGLERYSDWVRGLAVLHILVALPRLLWGIHLPIRSVRRRLLVSHLLTGIVPLALVLIFWGLGTYLSVNGERARIAARLLTEEARELGSSLGAAVLVPEDAHACLQGWVRMQSAVHPGIRVWLREKPGTDDMDLSSSPSGPLTRVYGEAVPREEAVSAWPDTVAGQGVVLLGGHAYLGAVRRNPGSPSGPPIVAVLIPTTSVLGGVMRRKLDAETFLETRWVVQSAAGELSLLSSTADTLGRRDRFGTAGGVGPSAAVVPALEWSDGAWHERMVLIWARVSFFNAVRGLARNVQENPFNLIPLIFLGVVAVLFVLVEVLTLGMVTSMGSSILRALAALRQGTARLRSGNLRYRIPVEGNDDLWDVAESFNEMAGDLDKARELEIERERLEGELNLARQIQARLLPAEAPVLAHVELAGLSVPARHVGGDYYDFLPLDGDRVGLIVADVSGKGIPAALLMSSFRASLLSQNLEHEGPGAVLGRLNSFLHRSVEPGRFVTAFLAVLTPATGELVYANAGHNPPLLLRSTGEPHLLREGGLILGLFADSVYEQARAQMGAGDLLALYTDGVSEATNEDEEFWGEERLLDLLRRRHAEPCRKILREILSEVRAFSGAQGQTDDITMVLARRRGGEAGT